MNVSVRLSAGLAHLIGYPRLTVTLADESTVADLLQHLRSQHPALESRLGSAIPMIGGQHVTPAERLLAGQEIALLLPVAGGAGKTSHNSES